MRYRLVLSIALFAGLGTLAAQRHLSIATGGTGGVYYPLGGGLAELINKYVPGYRAVAEVTGGSVENLGLVFRGEADIAMAMADTVHQAYHGQGPFRGRSLSALRVLAGLYPNALHVVTLEGTGIRTLADLKGKRVSVGAPGSGTEVSTRALLEANGVTYRDFRPQRLNFNETTNALRDGHIDAGFISVAPPASAILDLAIARRIVLVSATEAEIAAARAREPVYSLYRIRPGTYPGQDSEILALNTPNVLVSTTGLSDDLAYRIVKSLFEHVEELVAVHPAARETTLEFTLEAAPIPLHPGALRYYRERGVLVPGHLAP